MNNFSKYFLLGIGLLILVAAVTVATVFILQDRHDSNFTGGNVTDNQKKYDAVFYGLNLEVLSEEQSIKGFVKVGIRPITNDLQVVELDLIDNFEVSKITINQQALSHEHDNNKLLIFLDAPLLKNRYAELSIHYSGNPLEAIRPPWIGGFNWSKDSNGDDWIGVSCQGEGGQVWFPCKTHPSDEPDSVAINITVPKPYYCASNGTLNEITEPREGYFTYHWFTRYPTNNYNISINIAKYEVLEKSYVSIDNNEIPVIYYYLNDPEEKADSLINMAIDMLKTLEKFYGEYPFADEKFGLAETSYLGMEHQTINSYGNDYKFTERNGFKFDWLMLHEMTHEWWGNKVTVKDWADFWIHEGIGTYSEALYLLDKLGEDGYHNHMLGKKRGIKNNSPILKSKNATSSEAYVGDIYTKGAYFMHSLRYMLGDSIFFPTLYQFANDPAYTYENLVETKDFLSLVNENYGKDLTYFFDFYLKTNDLIDFNIDSLNNNKWRISISNIDFELPVEIMVDGVIKKYIVGKKPIEINAESKVLVDPLGWYLHQKDFDAE